MLSEYVVFISLLPEDIAKVLHCDGLNLILAERETLGEDLVLHEV